MNRARVPNKPLSEVLSKQELNHFDGLIKAHFERLFGKRETFDLEAEKRKAWAYTPPPPTCEHCNDLGMCSYAVEMGDPLFGKMFNCPHCEKGREMNRDLWRRKYKLSELPAMYQGFTFSSWNDTLDEEKLAGKYQAYTAAVQFVESPDHMVDLMAIYQQWGIAWEDGRDQRPKNSLVFYGEYGTGKSGLMAAIVNELLSRGESCLYVSTHGMLEDVQDSYAQDAEQRTKEVMNKYKTAPILFVDDFNIHRTSADKLDKIEQIVRYRYVNNLPTLMTMNIGQDEFTRMWSDRSGVAVVAMAHWIKLEGAVLRRSDPPVNDEQWWQR